MFSIFTNIAANAAKMNERISKEKRNITAIKAVKVLAENGVVVTEKEAENVLEMMYFLAKLIVNQNFKK